MLLQADSSIARALVHTAQAGELSPWWTTLEGAGSVASVVGLVLTALTALGVWGLRKRFGRKNRLPELVAEMDARAETINALIAQFERVHDEIDQEAILIQEAILASIRHVHWGLIVRAWQDRKAIGSLVPVRNKSNAQDIRTKARALAAAIAHRLNDDDVQP